MEILDLRHFSSPPTRDPYWRTRSRFGRNLLSWDYSGSASMILRYVDTKILPGYAALERGRVAGYAFFVYESSKGVIGDLFVADGGAACNWTRRPSKKLMTHVIETLQQSPGGVALRPNYCCTSWSTGGPLFVAGFPETPPAVMLPPIAQGTNPMGCAAARD